MTPHNSKNNSQTQLSDGAASERHREAAIEQIEQHLSLCRRRLRRAELGSLLIEYLLSTSLAIAIASGLFLTFKLIFALGSFTQAGSTERVITVVDYAYAATLAVALMAFGIVIVVRLLHRLPSSIAAAERLDRAARDHNRVANALWLLQEDFDPDSPLCMAAIRDGVEHIERLQDSQPDTTATKHALGQYWLRFTTAGLLLLLYVVTIISPLPALWSPSANTQESAMASQGRIAGVDSLLLASAEDETATPRPADTRSAPADSSDPNSSKAAQSPQSGPRPSTQQNAAPTSRGKNSAATRSESGTGSSGQSADGGASNAADSKKKKTPKAPKHSARKPASGRSTPPEKQKDNRSSSSAGGGGSSGGSMLAVQNSWSLQAQATQSEDTEDDDEGEAEEEEQESNKQRGGIQPSLKDRNQAPSRELGIGEGDGPPGSGRGGPTPPKKSRGTASMVLGVPMPDFVKGRLGPGATKITHEQVTPTPQPGQAASAVPVGQRSLPESPLSRFNLRAGDSELVRQYLIFIHSADQRNKNRK